MSCYPNYLCCSSLVIVISQQTLLLLLLLLKENHLPLLRGGKEIEKESHIFPTGYFTHGRENLKTNKRVERWNNHFPKSIPPARLEHLRATRFSSRWCWHHHHHHHQIRAPATTITTTLEQLKEKEKKEFKVVVVAAAAAAADERSLRISFIVYTMNMVQHLKTPMWHIHLKEMDCS